MDTDQQGPPPGSIVTPIANDGPPPGSVITPLAQPAPTQPAVAASATAQPGLMDTIKHNAKASLAAFLDPIQGLGEGTLQTAVAVAQNTHDLAEKIHPGLGETLAPQDGIDGLRQASQADNGTQATYRALENVGEFMMGDEALKGLSLSERIPKVATALARLEKSPRLLKIATTAMRQGAVGAGQSLAHGSTVGQAAVTGGVDAATGGALEGVGELYNTIKPGTSAIAGQEFPELASQRPGGSKIGGSTAANTPKFAKPQQAAGQAVLKDNAQEATRAAIERFNNTRGAVKPLEDPARLLSAGEDAKPQTFTLPTGEAPEEERIGSALVDARKKHIGTTVEAGNPTANTNSKGVRKVPLYQYLTGAKPGTVPQEISVKGAGVLQTTDPTEAESWLSRLNEIDNKGVLTKSQQGARRDLEQQLDMHYAGQNARYTDPELAASRVQTHGEGADQLRAAAKPIFQTLDRVSGGRFNVIKNAHEAAQKAIQDASDDAELADAHKMVNKANADMQRLFDRFGGQVNADDLHAARNAWADASTLDRVHNTLEGQFNGVTPKTLADSLKDGGRPLTRALSNPSTKRIGRLEANEGIDRLNAVLGPGAVTDFQRVNQLLEGPDTREKTFHYLAHTAHFVGHVGVPTFVGGAIGAGGAALGGGDVRKGAEVGGAAGFFAGLGGRAVLRQMATNPNVGKYMDYAVRHGVDPKIAIPIIAGSMSTGVQGAQQ